MIPPSAALDAADDRRRHRRHDATRRTAGDHGSAARAGWPSGGSRRTRRSRAPSPRWRSPGRTATPRPRCTIVGKPATDSYAAALQPLRGRARPGAARSRFAGHASDATVAAAYAERRRAGGDVGARGLLRAGGRGDGGRTARRGVRPGSRARGARRRPGCSCPTRTRTRWRPSIGALLADAPARGPPWPRPGAGGWPSSTSARRPIASSTCWSPRRAAGPHVVSAVHQFVPMLHRGDAVGRHTLRLRDVMAARGIRSQVYVETGRPRDRRRDAPVRELRRRGRRRRRARLPVRDGLGHGRVARRPHRDARRELPQRHAARVLRALGQRHGPPPAPGPGRSCARWRPAPRSASPCRPSTRRSCARAGFARTAVVPPAGHAPCRRRTAPRRHRRRDASASAGAGARWVSVGRLAPNKGHRVRRDGAPGGPRRTTIRAATLDVVGPARRAVVHAAPCAASSTSIGLHDAVTFTGAVSDAELAAAMAGADVLVVTLASTKASACP